jgi:hypothetical protein
VRRIVIEYLAYNLPLAVSWLILVVAYYACIALGSEIKRRLVKAGGGDEKPFEVAQGAVFVLAALILGFSFSFATSRFDARRALVTEEANAIGTSYLRAGYLPAGAADRFRQTLREYAKARLAMYASDAAIGAAAEGRSRAMQETLWSIIVGAARADPRNVQLGLLTDSVNETIDVSARQAGALRARVPAAMLGLMLIVSFASTILVGLHFARMDTPQVVLGLIFALLFGTVVATIVDLDRPQQGLVRVDLTSLQDAVRSMR